MILGCDSKRTVCEVYTPKIGVYTFHDEKINPPQPLYIIREATYEEYYKFVKETYEAAGRDFSTVSLAPRWKHFYEVSTD